jgi:hypothetical protein
VLRMGMTTFVRLVIPTSNRGAAGERHSACGAEQR